MNRPLTPTLGQAITDMACRSFRETLEGIAGADPAVIDEAVAYFRAKHEREHCRACGTFVSRREDGTANPCVHCTRPRRPWPKSRQGYRASRRIS